MDMKIEIEVKNIFDLNNGYTDEELVKELQYKVDLIQDIMNQITDKGINNLEKELKDE